ncbi:hypothetical protein V1477_001378 [Vespula maculifrons]|uniref:Uncharacterized protein n=1 Tax=Vespula maculifrons TaxID=7453 RepID=A0ABD2D1Y8_VESMC
MVLTTILKAALSLKMIKASYTIKVFIVLRDNSVSPDTLLNYALICSRRSVWFNVPNYFSEYSRHIDVPQLI